MKWNNVHTCKNSDYHYSRGKLYCCDFTINKRFDEFNVFYGYYVNIKNSKTKDYFNTKERWDLTFKSVEEAKVWCETYARITYYKVFNKYRNWIGNEQPVPGKKGKKYVVYRPETEEEWQECLAREREWDKEIKNKFKNTDVDALYDEIKEDIATDEVKIAEKEAKKQYPYEVIYELKTMPGLFNKITVMGRDREHALCSFRNVVRWKDVNVKDVIKKVEDKQYLFEIEYEFKMAPGIINTTLITGCNETEAIETFGTIIKMKEVNVKLVKKIEQN